MKGNISFKFFRLGPKKTRFTLSAYRLGLHTKNCLKNRLGVLTLSSPKDNKNNFNSSAVIRNVYFSKSSTYSRIPFGQGHEGFPPALLTLLSKNGNKFSLQEINRTLFWF